MSRNYALRRLLEHGPLKFRELVEITGWGAREVGGALSNLMAVGLVSSFKPRPNGRAVYELCNAPNAK